MTWQPIETAPKDGTWLLLEGEFSGGDTSSTRVGRWNPTVCQLGSQWLTYEWEVIEQTHGKGWDEVAVPEFNQYADGVPTGWMPLPTPPETPTPSLQGADISQEQLREGAAPNKAAPRKNDRL